MGRLARNLRYFAAALLVGCGVELATPLASAAGVKRWNAHAAIDVGFDAAFYLIGAVLTGLCGAWLSWRRQPAARRRHPGQRPRPGDQRLRRPAALPLRLKYVLILLAIVSIPILWGAFFLLAAALRR